MLQLPELVSPRVYAVPSPVKYVPAVDVTNIAAVVRETTDMDDFIVAAVGKLYRVIGMWQMKECRE